MKCQQRGTGASRGVQSMRGSKAAFPMVVRMNVRPESLLLKNGDGLVGRERRIEGMRVVAAVGRGRGGVNAAAAAPVNPKIRIKLKSYWVDLLQDTVDKISDVATNTGATIAGPVPLPTKCVWWCSVLCGGGGSVSSFIFLFLVFWSGGSPPPFFSVCRCMYVCMYVCVCVCMGRRRRRKRKRSRTKMVMR